MNIFRPFGELQLILPNIAFTDKIITNERASMKPGQIRYSLILNGRGGTLDDVLVYSAGEEGTLLVVNAGNRKKIWDWIAVQRVGFVGRGLRDFVELPRELRIFRGHSRRKLLVDAAHIELVPARLHDQIGALDAGAAIGVEHSTRGFLLALLRARIDRREWNCLAGKVFPKPARLGAAQIGKAVVTAARASLRVSSEPMPGRTKRLRPFFAAIRTCSNLRKGNEKWLILPRLQKTSPT